jgi:hypothetical protein
MLFLFEEDISGLDFDQSVGVLRERAAVMSKDEEFRLLKEGKVQVGECNSEYAAFPAGRNFMYLLCMMTCVAATALQPVLKYKWSARPME